MKIQPLKAKAGEINYRREFTTQQLKNEKIFSNEFVGREYQDFLKSKLKETEKLFKTLKKKGIPLSPYLEIGSEHSLRPAILDSKFNARGYATDISFFSLTKAGAFAKEFAYPKTPKTICADAYNLPFKSNSIPFIFFYETLHHFPHPKPVLKEAKRVLAPGGLCLIGSDPIKQALQITLWRRPNKLRSWEKPLKYTLILPFISHIGKTEVDHGILEEAFLPGVWQDSLSIFDKVEAQVKVFPFGPTKKFNKTSRKNWVKVFSFHSFLLFFLGGGVQAFCFKEGKLPSAFQNPQDLLICLNCKKNNKEITIKKDNTGYTCPNCSSYFPKSKGVLILLEENLRKKLPLK